MSTAKAIVALATQERRDAALADSDLTVEQSAELEAIALAAQVVEILADNEEGETAKTALTRALRERGISSADFWRSVMRSDVQTILFNQIKAVRAAAAVDIIPFWRSIVQAQVDIARSAEAAQASTRAASWLADQMDNIEGDAPVAPTNLLVVQLIQQHGGSVSLATGDVIDG